MEKQIEWAPGYSVDDSGAVYSRRLNSGRMCNSKRKELKFDQSGKQPHKRVSLSVNGDIKRMLVHRLVAEAFLKPPEGGRTIIRHLDGDPTNNNVDNLAWGTYVENEEDKKRHGRNLSGERNHRAKLCWNDVRDIRTRLRSGSGVCALADEWGLDRNTISNIKANRSWVE